MYVIIYNPKSKGGKSKEVVEKIVDKLKELNETYRFQNVLEIEDVGKFICALNEDEHPLFVGGDGTLHFLANKFKKYQFEQDIYAYPSGTGNDFFRNIDNEDNIVHINEYMEDLPTFNNGTQEEVFLNGLGVGIDALVCEYVAETKGGNAFSYTKNTIKAFLKYKPRPMKLIIDDQEYDYKKCWTICCMNAIHQGGGMKFAPLKTRNDGTLDVLIVHTASRLKLLFLFLSIYKGKHLKYKKYVSYIKGKSVKIIAEGNPSMQADGEVYTNIKELSVKVH
ncbi:MAG: diacylglycerol kinase family protein [Bacilli bacterium]|nr:diacylglycerol kinase family protein [Bacilli bacterium]